MIQVSRKENGYVRDSPSYRQLLRGRPWRSNRHNSMPSKSSSNGHSRPPRGNGYVCSFVPSDKIEKEFLQAIGHPPRYPLLGK